MGGGVLEDYQFRVPNIVAVHHHPFPCERTPPSPRRWRQAHLMLLPPRELFLLHLVKLLLPSHHLLMNRRQDKRPTM